MCMKISTQHSFPIPYLLFLLFPFPVQNVLRYFAEILVDLFRIVLKIFAKLTGTNNPRDSIR